MKKIIIGGLVGGIILFVWSFLAWVVLPLHTPSMHKIPNEDAVMSMLKQSLPDKAVYLFPHGPGMTPDQSAQNAWAEKMKQGPTGMIIFNPNGTDPMMPGQMLVGFVLDLLSALLVAWLLTRSTALGSSFAGRVAFCGMFGIFAMLFDYLMMWNWMGYPGDFTVGLILDGIIAWLLAGLGIAAIVKAPRTE